MKKNAPSFPITVKQGFATVKIYVGNQKDGTPVYSVQWWQAGKRHREAFKNLEEAKVKAQNAANKLSTGETAVLELTNLDRALYIRALDALKPTGTQLDAAAIRYAAAFKLLGSDLILEAARDYAKRHPQGMPRKTVSEVFAELIESKAKAKLSKRHIGDLRSRCGLFKDSFPGTPILSITSAEIRRYLDGKAPRTFKNHLNAIKNLFGFAVGRGYLIDMEAFKGIDLPKDPGGDIEIYSPEELRLLLDHAEPDLLPFIAIGAFAGIRTAELCRLDWQEISADYIEIKAGKAKTAARRLPPICPALAAWLVPYRQASGPVVKCKVEQITKRTAALVEAINAAQAKSAAPFRWKANALRHSFISYRLAEVQDVGKVALEAGNSAQMIFAHYRELVKPAQAKAWFSVTPERPANLIAMTQAATA